MIAGMEPTRTIVIGCGRRAGIADNQVLAEAGFIIVAGVDPDPGARARWAEKHPDATTYGDLAAALAAERPAAAVITSPDFCHADDACAALEAGCAVYLEKPLAITIPDADRILATAQRTGSKLYVGHNMRHFPCVLAMKRLIDEGAIGRVQAAWCRHFISYGGDAYFKDWHSERRYGTGLLLQKGAHDIDILHWLCGASTRLAVGMGRLSVYDQTEHRPSEEPGVATWNDANWPPTSQIGTNPQMDVEDHSMVLLQLANGVQASYLQCHYTPDSCRNYTIIGDAGRIENVGDHGNWKVHVYRQRGAAFGAPDEVIEGGGDEGGHGGADPRILREFAAYVRDDAPISVSAVAARDAVAAGCAATESLRDGCTPRAIPPVAAEVAAYFERAERGAEVGA